MSRKEWLETFVWLADRNKPAMDYRLQLHIPISHVGKHIRNLDAYRRELEDLRAQETKAALEQLQEAIDASPNGTVEVELNGDVAKN